MKLILSFVLLLSSAFLSAQNTEIDIIIVNSETRQAIQNVHAFLINTTFGAVTTIEGTARIQFPSQIKDDLFITHIGFDSRLFSHSEYTSFGIKDTIELIPNNLELEEIVVTGERSNKWKKHFKRFKTAFLGTHPSAKKCKIINPEVIRFEEVDGVLTASSIDLIEIENLFLGYVIQFNLIEFMDKKDGSQQFYGRAKYTDISHLHPDNNFEKNRSQTYLGSPKRFFKSVINNSLEEDGYAVDFVSYKKNEFHSTKKVQTQDLLSVIGKGDYRIVFPEFLQIANTNIKAYADISIGTQRGGNRYGSFGSRAGGGPGRINHATSYLSKTEKYIKLNEFGNVINVKSVQEYGFWGQQRQSQILPFDYGNNYSQKKEVIEAGLTAKEIFTLFHDLVHSKDDKSNNEIIFTLLEHWEPEMVPPLVEILRLSSDKLLIKQIYNILYQKTGEKDIRGFFEWMLWMWNNEPSYKSYYTDFKGDLYKNIDPLFGPYFTGRHETAEIRIDEIVWGGVRQDGIPPLRLPRQINANQADYLADSDLVFGAYINGIAKAYPKRILAWHEMFVDDFGDSRIAGVYCTLCGTVIAYDMTHDSITHNLGTSGFLYRSNKLMYDKATQSLWSTIEGKPVLGPLAGKGIELDIHPIVTTSWGEWKKSHPTTKVLSINTGHDRDYAEGAAYREYFATDELMFPVPQLNPVLDNKEEVLIIRAEGYRDDPIAISTTYLKRKKWYTGHVSNTNFVVLTDKSNAARVFDIKDYEFDSFKRWQLKDINGQVWTIDGNVLLGPNGESLRQIPSHNIFWFAWYNSYPETRLIK